MAETGQVIPLKPDVAAPEGPDFAAESERLGQLLIDHTLVQSWRRCRRAGQPYGFPDPGSLLPEHGAGRLERPYQNTALLFAVDGRLPVGLNKHFRLRASSRISWRNLRGYAPELDMSEPLVHRADAPPERAIHARDVAPGNDEDAHPVVEHVLIDRELKPRVLGDGGQQSQG